MAATPARRTVLFLQEDGGETRSYNSLSAEPLPWRNNIDPQLSYGQMIAIEIKSPSVKGQIENERRSMHVNGNFSTILRSS